MTERRMMIKEANMMMKERTMMREKVVEGRMMITPRKLPPYA